MEERVVNELFKTVSEEGDLQVKQEQNGKKKGVFQKMPFLPRWQFGC
jgi:hypothetical protein